MDTTDAAVELYYGTDRGDVREVLRWRVLGSPGGRGQLLRRLVLVPSAPLVLLAAGHGRATDPAALACAAGVGMALGAGCLALDVRRLARRLYRWTSKYPVYHGVLGERGLRVHRPDGSTKAHPWERFASWTETPNLFVLIRRTTGEPTWLAKRGVPAPADVDRIRAILDRNLKRL
ncbi:YcxB family protein [Streptomyces sp. NPDC091268]|uniref:YcxB family protein n=1 Tax=Streptomyces sp. NPDC091268 TaxID=3365979 RepID=UPI0038250A0B